MLKFVLQKNDSDEPLYAGGEIIVKIYLFSPFWGVPAVVLNNSET